MPLTYIGVMNFIIYFHCFNMWNHFGIVLKVFDFVHADIGRSFDILHNYSLPQFAISFLVDYLPVKNTVIK